MTKIAAIILRSLSRLSIDGVAVVTTIAPPFGDKMADKDPKLIYQLNIQINEYIAFFNNVTYF